MTEITPEMIEAAALKWATIDGKKNRFLGDKDGKFGDCDGTYEGYCEEARQVLTAAFAAAPAPQPGEVERQQCAAIIDEMLSEKPWKDKSWARMALMIAARAVRRGRHLTAHERFQNIVDWAESGECLKRHIKADDEDNILVSPAPPAELDRLKAENERMKVMLADFLPPNVEWKERDVDSVLVHHKISLIKDARAYLRDGTLPQTAAEARITELEASEKRMREALEWYEEQARLGTMIAGRKILERDGGEKARAALSVISNRPVTVADGWKLVPINPTPKQLQCAAFNLCSVFGVEFVQKNEDFARAVYAEFLAASPVSYLSALAKEGE